MTNPFLLPVTGSCPAVSETGQVVYQWWSHDIVCVLRACDIIGGNVMIVHCFSGVSRHVGKPNL